MAEVDRTRARTEQALDRRRLLRDEGLQVVGKRAACLLDRLLHAGGRLAGRGREPDLEGGATFGEAQPRQRGEQANDRPGLAGSGSTGEDAETARGGDGSGDPLPVRRAALSLVVREELDEGCGELRLVDRDRPAGPREQLFGDFALVGPVAPEVESPGAIEDERGAHRHARLRRWRDDRREAEQRPAPLPGRERLGQAAAQDLVHARPDLAREEGGQVRAGVALAHPVAREAGGDQQVHRGGASGQAGDEASELDREIAECVRTVGRFALEDRKEVLERSALAREGGGDPAHRGSFDRSRPSVRPTAASSASSVSAECARWKIPAAGSGPSPTARR